MLEDFNNCAYYFNMRLLNGTLLDVHLLHEDDGDNQGSVQVKYLLLYNYDFQELICRRSHL
jgi:hypothetical protein